MCQKCPAECSSCSRASTDKHYCDCVAYTLQPNSMIQINSSREPLSTISMEERSAEQVNKSRSDEHQFADEEFESAWGETCVLECGKGTFETLPRTQNSSGICELCHPLCDSEHTCLGPAATQCNRCRVVSAFLLFYKNTESSVSFYTITSNFTSLYKSKQEDTWLFSHSFNLLFKQLYKLLFSREAWKKTMETLNVLGDVPTIVHLALKAVYAVMKTSKLRWHVVETFTFSSASWSLSLFHSSFSISFIVAWLIAKSMKRKLKCIYRKYQPWIRENSLIVPICVV